MLTIDGRVCYPWFVMMKIEQIKNNLTPEQILWAEVFHKTQNGMGAVRLVWPHTADNPGYQNTRAWKLKNNKRVISYLEILKAC